jgi:hypothetical protein
MKTRSDVPVPPKTGLGAQNLKTGPDALGTTEIGSESTKHENWTLAPSVPSKMGPGVQNMKNELVALGTAENESKSARREN